MNYYDGQVLLVIVSPPVIISISIAHRTEASEGNQLENPRVLKMHQIPSECYDYRGC